MASSSSSSPCQPNGRWTYEVFLSFRGEDTRSNFVDHLYASLVQRGVHTFKDDEMLRRGKQISPELLQAIEESRTAVIVFSENYANSSWCLDELAKIMECKYLMGQRVLPVFYHVDPSDVRRQKGIFGTTFELEEGKYAREPEKVNKWRDALVAASSISGFHFSKSDGGEASFINKIVLDILSNIKHFGTENNLIGIESHLDVLMSLLNTKATKEVRIIGIHGMGGIGKTTIAQAIFRRIAYKFDGSSFVKDVRENSCNKKDICSLQMKILKDVLMVHHLRVDDPDEGAETIQKRLSNKKVLLVLDDVDNDKQLNFLAATHEWFGPGSRIIITTRNEHLLSHADEKYKPGLLLMNQAVELFSRHAFKKNRPPERYEELSHRVICYTGGLPLALQVLGSFFHGRHVDVWQSALNRLEKTPNSEIFQTLKLSFDGLEDSEKKIFLDIACFFKGKEKEHVIRILESFGFDPVIGISVLIEKSLITVSKDRIDMHDLIQEMGWKIVRDYFSNSRIWQLEELHDLIMRQEELKAIEAIVLRKNDEKLGFSTEVFERMTNLRLLDIYSNFSSTKPNFLQNFYRESKERFFKYTEFPYELRWICWHDYPFLTLPITRLHKLVGLEMVNSSIHHLWEGKKILPNLKFINFSESRYITSFPDVSGVPNMERLVLSSCTELVEFHESLGLHPRLKYLDVSWCVELKCLPSMIKMESLETLILSYCTGLEIFPEVSPCMVKLSKIYIDHCCKLEELPSSIGYLSGLSVLHLISCKNFKNVPNSICKLKNLKSLHFYNCENLQKFPEELGSMVNLEELLVGLSKSFFRMAGKSISIRSMTSWFSLRKLDLSWREIEEKDFPENFHQFSSLEELYLCGNTILTQLPAGVSSLSSLKFLEVSNCVQLQNLLSLPSRIQVLQATGCFSLEKIGNLSEEYEWLYKIWLFDCHKLLRAQDNGRYLDKMSLQSFLKKCAALGHRLSIGIPGSKVPSWFKEECHGCNITLKLHPKCHTEIMGFAVCGVFQGDWGSSFPRIIFKISNDENVIPLSKKVDYVNASRVGDDENVWISYIPFNLFQKMYHDLQPEDWAHVEGNLVITLMKTDGNKSVRCGANIVYKKDLESIQCNNTSYISDYEKMVKVNVHNNQKDLDYDARVSGNTYVCEEILNDKNLNLNPFRTRMSTRNIMDRRIVVHLLRGGATQRPSGWMRNEDEDVDEDEDDYDGDDDDDDDDDDDIW